MLTDVLFLTGSFLLFDFQSIQHRFVIHNRVLFGKIWCMSLTCKCKVYFMVLAYIVLKLHVCNTIRGEPSKYPNYRLTRNKTRSHFPPL